MLNVAQIAGSANPIPPDTETDVVPTAPVVSASATNYYVSSSIGDDSNDGLSALTPWKTLYQLSTLLWVPGSTINLFAGDTWSNQTMFLFGGGTLAGTTPDYIGSNWVTVTKYGVGANPVIAAYGRDNGIRLDRDDPTPAWKFVDISIVGSKYGFDSERIPPASMNDGLWLEGILIENISGSILYDGSGPLNPIDPLAWCSTGIVISNRSNMVIKDCTVTRCEMAANITAYDTLLIDAMIATDNTRAGIWVRSGFGQPFYPFNYMSQNLLIKDSQILRTGAVGMSWGMAGLQLDGGKDLTVQDTEVAYTHSPAGIPDQIGIDIEVVTENATLLRVNIHDCTGEPVLLWDHYPVSGIGSQNINTQLLDCVFTHNGLYPTPLKPAIMIKNLIGVADACVISGCTITKRESAQKLFGDPPTDTIPAWFIWGIPNPNTII